MITGTFTSKTGVVTIEIDNNGPDHEIEIQSMGKVKYEFDQTPEQVDIDRVQVIYNKFTFTTFMKTLAKADIYEVIADAIDDSDDLTIPVVLKVNPHNAIQYQFNFTVGAGNIKPNELDQTIKFDCVVDLDDEAPSISVFDMTDPSSVEQFTHQGYDYDAISPFSWISQALKKVFKNSYDNNISTANILGEGYYTDKSYPAYGVDVEGLVGFAMVRMEDSDFDQLAEEQVDGNGLIEANRFGATNEWILTARDGNFNETVEAGSAISITWKRYTGFSADDYEHTFRVAEVLSGTQVKTTQTNMPSTVNTTPETSNWFIIPVIKPSQIKALDTLKELAGIEGSIFGSAFGRNFFINRLQQADIVNIDYNDITVFDGKYRWNSLGDSFVESITDYRQQGAHRFGNFNQGGPRKIPNLIQAGSIIQGPARAAKRLEISLTPGYPFLSKGKINLSGSIYVINGSYEIEDGNGDVVSSWDTDRFLEFKVSQSGIQSYVSALSLRRAKSIEFEIFGANTIKPWNVIRIDNAPDKYSGKTYRPTSLEYDFVSDMVMVKAYDISQEQEATSGDVQGAVDSDGAVSFTISTSVEAPENLTACKDTTGGFAKLTWDDGGSVADSYNVYRNGAVIANITATTYNDTTPEQNPDSNYAYEVTAIKGGIESAKSNSIVVRYSNLSECA